MYAYIYPFRHDLKSYSMGVTNYKKRKTCSVSSAMSSFIHGCLCRNFSIQSYFRLNKVHGHDCYDLDYLDDINYAML